MRFPEFTSQGFHASSGPHSNSTVNVMAPRGSIMKYLYLHKREAKCRHVLENPSTTVYHSIPQYTTVPRLPALQDLTVRLLDDVSVGIPFDAVLIARFRIQHDEFVSLPSKGANESLSAKEQQKIGQKLGHGWAWGQGVSTC